MNTILFKDKEYPKRTLLVKIDGVKYLITIATESLSDAMGDEKEVFDTVANNIDNNIYFYILDELITLPPKELAENHLDTEITFIEELE